LWREDLYQAKRSDAAVWAALEVDAGDALPERTH
jgi:hypothetical protein